MAEQMTEQTVEKRPEPTIGVAERTRTGRTFVPNVDILEQGDHLTMLADMPGVRGEEIDIQFEKGVLTISGRVQPRQVSGNALLREYGVGDFHRTFQISEMVDAQRITAEHRNGVLILTLPKAEAARPRKITVKSNGN